MEHASYLASARAKARHLAQRQLATSKVVDICAATWLVFPPPLTAGLRGDNGGCARRGGGDGGIASFRPEAVIHFAALKAVGQSVSMPLPYFSANVAGTVTLLEPLAASDCRRFVFSSSATVYGDPEHVPVDRTHPRSVRDAPEGCSGPRQAFNFV